MKYTASIFALFVVCMLIASQKYNIKQLTAGLQLLSFVISVVAVFGLIGLVLWTKRENKKFEKKFGFRD